MIIKSILIDLNNINRIKKILGGIKTIMKNNKLRTWLDDFNLSHPLVIAGPCSAETEKQVLTIAHELKDTDVSILEQDLEAKNKTWNVWCWCNRLEMAKKVKEETGS